ncbi:MAG: CPBP family intramembrane metalloprotease [Clostridia bacterium]|nr:CPBP family intramembrane metalloprotease [Clostridia bacterium]
MINNFFKKHETLACILLIVLYVVTNSICLNNFGITSLETAIVNAIFSIFLIVLTAILKRGGYYGLKKPKNSKKFLYFLPLILIVSVNLWNGFNVKNTPLEILFHTITMLNVGFIEELIFRGYLFKMMEKSNVKVAIIVSALTFGIGHIVNLLNGAELIPTLLQICYAVSIGYLFVIIFYKSGSIWPCIIAHSLTNALSIFNVTNHFSLYIEPIFLIVFPLIYAFVIHKTTKQ